ncbi:MAG: hypothetical protein WC337_04860, partial [Candidatus Muiribacteriota bacterium]
MNDENQFYLIYDNKLNIESIENFNIINSECLGELKNTPDNSIIFIDYKIFEKSKNEILFNLKEKTINFVIISENSNQVLNPELFNIDYLCMIFKGKYEINDLISLAVNYFKQNPACFAVKESLVKIEDYEDNVIFIKTSKCVKSVKNITVSDFSEKLSKSIKNLKIRGVLKFFIFEHNGCIFSGKVEEFDFDKNSINSHITEIVRILDIYENKKVIKILDEKSSLLSDVVYEVINITFAYLLREDYLNAVLGVLSKLF